MKLITANHVKIGNFIVLNKKAYKVESIQPGDVYKFFTFDQALLKKSQIRNEIVFRYRDMDLVQIAEGL